jgi:hypothetical protein
MPSAVVHWPPSARACLVRPWALLLVLVGWTALLVGSATGPAPGAAALAVGALGSAALVACAFAALAGVLLQGLTGGRRRSGVRGRAWAATHRRIRRAEEPGRPGRPRPRAPGAGRIPCLVMT